MSNTNQSKEPCTRCNGSGVVDDGEMDCSSGGIPYENGPVKCVKDCPACGGRSEPAPLSILRELVEANRGLAAYKASDGLEGYRRMRARERAAWQAAYSFFDRRALSSQSEGSCSDALNKLETALRFQRNGIVPTADEGVEFMLALAEVRSALSSQSEAR